MNSAGLLVCVVLLVLLGTGVHARPPSSRGSYVSVPHSALQSVSAWLTYELSLNFTDDEVKCLDKDLLFYKGKCYRLFSEEPCNGSEWLVFDKREALNGTGALKAVCLPKPCPPGYGYMAANKQCHDHKVIATVLCPGLEFTHDLFGEGRCHCGETYGMKFGSNDKVCYEFYGREPCSNGSVFLPMDGIFNLGFGECRRNPCFNPDHKHHIMLFEALLKSGEKECYELTSPDVCSYDKTLYFIVPEVLAGKHIFKCDYYIDNKFGIGVHTKNSNCVTDNSNECHKTASFVTPEWSSDD